MATPELAHLSGATAEGATLSGATGQSPSAAVVTRKAPASRWGQVRAWLRPRPLQVRSRVLPRLKCAAAVLTVAMAGSATGAALAPATTTSVGPFTVDVRVVPSVHPGVQLLLPPAGRVDFVTHLAPVAVQAAIDEVDLEGARRLLGSRTALDELERSAPETLRRPPSAPQPPAPAAPCWGRCCCRCWSTAAGGVERRRSPLPWPPR